MLFNKTKKDAAKQTTKPRRGIAWALGFTDLARGFRTQAEVIAESGSRMVLLWNHGKAALAKAKRKGRTETFEAAVQRLNLSESFLEHRRKQQLAEGCLFAAGWLVIFYFFCINLFAGEVWGVLPNFGLLLFVGALSFQGFFRAWQIKVRRLDGPRQFVRETLGV